MISETPRILADGASLAPTPVALHGSLFSLICEADGTGVLREVRVLDNFASRPAAP